MTSPSSFVQQLNFWARDASNESAGLQAALGLGLFEQLPAEGEAEGPSMAELAERVGGTLRGTRSIVEPLLGLGFVVASEEGRLSLRRDAAGFLRDAGYLEALRAIHPWWHVAGKLVEAVRSGAAVSQAGRDWELLEWLSALFRPGVPAGPSSPRSLEFYDRLARNFMRTQVLITAGAIGLLERLSEGPKDLAALASTTQAHPRGVEILLEVLTSCGLTEKEAEGRYRYTPPAAHSLDAQGLPYFLRGLKATTEYWEGLGELADAIRHQRFVLDLKDPETARRIYSENASRITGIFAAHLKLGRKAASIVRQARSLAGADILDVGTGSGVWGAAFAQAEPTARITYLDSEHVLVQVRENIARLKLANPATFWAADCTAVDFGTGTYDLILLPQVIPVLRPHERSQLFERVARALRPGGLLVVSGYLLTDRRDGPMDALYFSLRRYMSNEGDVLSRPDFLRELGAVGLTTMRSYPLPVQDLVLASRGDVALPETPPGSEAVGGRT
jgi:SAM-dependent methyltransferase/DNA-binding transcriptional ArsR family regulator